MSSCGQRLIAPALLAAIIWGSPQDYEGKPIRSIRFDPATQPLEDSELRRILPVFPGEPLRLDLVSLAIQRMFATGRYEDIAADATLEDGGVILTFQTKGALFVGAVTVTEPREPPNVGQLISATKLELGAEFTLEDLEQAVRHLQDTLRANGYYKAQVEPLLERDPAKQQLNLRFRIEAGPRARFTEPIVKGSPGRPVADVIDATHWERFWGLPGYKSVDERRVQQGLQRVRESYQKHDHLMAKVTLEEMVYLERLNRARPVLNVEAGPKIEIRTSGAKVSRGRLRRLVPVFEERAVDRDLLIEGTRNLTTYFQSQGYFDAEVDVETKDIDSGRQVIEFTIDRGLRYKLVHTEIKGTRYFDEPTLRERIAVTPASLLRYRWGRYSEDMLERDVAAIRSLYQANGFATVDVKTRVEQNYGGKEREVAVFFDIVEGAQWFVAGLDVTGVDLREYDQVRGMLQSIVGQPYSELNIATDRDTILTYYYNNGFPDARFDFSVQPSGEPNTVDLRFMVIEGRRQFVRDVLVSGLETTDSELVRSRINLEPGDPLSQTQMVESQRRLYDLGIFARVDMALQNPVGRERNKYVLYQLEEASRYSVTGGVGAQIARIGGGSGGADFESPAGDVGFSPRVSLGLTRTNFLGQGHTIGFDSRLSTLQRRGLITYVAPRFKGSENLNLSFSALYEDARDVRTFSAQRLEGSVQLGQRLSRANTAQYRFSYRRVRVNQETLKITPLLIPLFSQPVRIGALSGAFIQDRRDDPIATTRGLYNTIDLGLASGVFGSQTNFIRLLFRNSTYHRLSRDVVLARTLTLGGLHALNGDDPRRDVPLPERFFAGGAASHRGFPDNQAGPRDLTTGFPIGGKALVVHGSELRFPLLGDHLGGVLFHDAGNVYSRLGRVSLRFSQRDLTDFDYTMHAIGFGLRYRTPVGPLRVDLAYGPNSPRFVGFKGTRDELLFGGGRITAQRINRLQFHFSLGQTF